MTDNIQPISRSTTRTLLRGLNLLELISEARDGATVTELAHATGLDKGTVSRLLATLRHAGWSNQSPEDRRYRLAGKAIALSHDYTNRVELRDLALPQMSDLRDRWNETVHLGVVEGNEVVYVERLEPAVPVRVVSVVGQRMPVASTAMGRATLSALPEEEMLSRLKSISLKPITTNTITDRERFVEELHRSAKRGYTMDDEENHLEVTCVGAAIFDVSERPIAAISASGPSFRMKAKVDLVGVAVGMAAREISQALGARPQGRTAT